MIYFTAQNVAPSSISHQNVNDLSVSKYSALTFDMKCDETLNTEEMKNKMRRFDLSRVKRATTYAAKKFHRISLKVKSNVIKPMPYMHSGDASCTQLIIMAPSKDDNDFDEIDLNEMNVNDRMKLIRKETPNKSKTRRLLRQMANKVGKSLKKLMIRITWIK